jgi:hypothetical protein
MEPKEIIRRLVARLPRCCCCDRPATRSGRGEVIIGDQRIFCDTHGFSDCRTGVLTEVSYNDLEDADATRAALDLLAS